MMGCRFSPCDESSAETGEVEILRRNHNGANCDADTKLATVEGLTKREGPSSRRYQGLFRKA